MGKWRQKMAAALVVSMMMGTVSAGTAFAEPEDTGKRAWEQTTDGWVFWRDKLDKDGYRYHRNRVVERDEKRGTFTYCFNEDGIMNGDEIVTLSDRQYNTLLESQGLDPDTYIPEAEILDEDAIDYVDGEISHEIYVYPDGPVAFDEWVVLDSDGHLASDPDEADCGWYYFGKDGLMVKNREVEGETGKGMMTFRLDAEGKMISSEFAAKKLLDAESGLTTGKYYNHMGESIVKKWQYIAGHWYSFDDQGYYNVGVASDSNAKFDEHGWLKEGQAKKEPDILSVQPSDEKTDKTVAVGKPVELKFTINLASPSNVESDWKFVLNRHDIWNKVTFTDSGAANLGVKSYQAKRGPLEAGENGLTKHVTITYTPLIPCETEVCLMIDEQTCVPYTVNATAGTVAAKGAVIKTMLSAKDGVAGEMDSALSPTVVKDNISMMFTDVQENERAALKDVWMTQKSSVADLDEQYKMANLVDKKTEVSDDALELLGDVDVESIQAAGLSLNAGDGQRIGLAIAEPEEKPELDPGEVQVAERLDVDISVLVDDTETSELEIPAILTIPLPNAFDGKAVKVYHTSDDGVTEEVTSAKTSGGKVSFAADEFSTYTFVATGTAGGEDNGDDNIQNGGGSSSSDDSSGSSSSATGTTVQDDKKGYVNSATGIVTGSGAGYSQWISEVLPGQTEESARWKLQYADGTYAAGSYMTDTDGNPVRDAEGNRMEQPAWELVNGAWFAFGVDGYVKSGFAFDPVLNGWFYLDINTGMKTGWQIIDGKWYYFNPVSDGTKGMMFKDKMTPDGYYVNADGVWDAVR